MRTLTTALCVGVLAGCAALSGEVDDGGRAYREATQAPVDANLEPLAGEASIQIFNDRLPSRADLGGGGRSGAGEPASACQAERYQNLIGTAQAEIDRRSLPEPSRVVEWGAMVTQDYQPNRLNVHLDQGGRVYRVICG
jgi:hypothetical protein